jgi:hypothetical protein
MIYVCAIVFILVAVAIWYKLNPEFFKGLERLDQDYQRQHGDEPPDGAIDDYIGWEEGEWD